MRNLIAFLKRFQIFLIFAALQGIALYAYFSNVYYPKTQLLSTVSIVNGEILSVKNDVTKHFALEYNNQMLQRENKALRERLPLSYMQVQRASYSIEDTLFDQQYTYIPATVINSTHDKRNNYFTLNVGWKQGIKRDMGVFSEKGILGVIYNVSEHYSVVKTVLTQNINIDVMIESSGAFGLLKWDGNNPRVGQISGISNDMRVKKWSKVVTRGGSGIFPRGLAVGKIRSIGTIEGKPLWDLNILYSEDYRKVRNVYVIKNLLRKEQETLEASIPEDKPIENP
jgi:rod shape-determining protein MreC